MVTQFVLTEQYVKIHCDLKHYDGQLRYPGIWIEARKNLTLGEQHDLEDRLKALNDELANVFDSQLDEAETIDAERERLLARPKSLEDGEVWKPDQKALRANAKRSRDLQADVKARANEIQSERRALVTPYIRSWNLYTANEEGTPVPLPPPRDGGHQVLDQVYPDLVEWMINTCSAAYRSGKALSSGTPSADVPEPMSEQNSGGPEATSSSPSRRSRSKS